MLVMSICIYIYTYTLHTQTHAKTWCLPQSCNSWYIWMEELMNQQTKGGSSILARGDNQNCAVIFTRGEILQMIDANQAGSHWWTQ